jgi:stearoyl-CoA desaturase (delta-9 desaturase)
VDLSAWSSWYYGLWDASALTIVLYTLVVTHVTIVAVTVFLHRYAAHRSLELHPILSHFFRFWLWLTTGMITREWAAIHRKHHATCETEDDPHSPQVRGIDTVFWKGTELYRAEAKNAETLDRYGKGMPDDWLERHVYTGRSATGIAIMAVTNVVLFGPIGLTVWAIQMAWIPILAAGVINGIGHWWGYRNFECPDAATNIVPWGILIGGEELHNNHHTYPNSAKLSQKSWEFDIGWMWIRLFQALGLAKPLSTGPVARQVPGREVIDQDTVWAVLNDRFRVMARYAEEVVGPAVEQEYRRADAATRNLLKRANGLLCREDTLVDDVDRQQISRVLDVSPVLETLYELRQGLQGIWAKRGGDTEEMIAAFKQWCLDAEATGLHSLRDFVAHLKSYTVPTLRTA